MLEHLDKQVHFTGIWLDENEISISKPEKRKGKYYDIPFWPANENMYNFAGIDPDALHFGGYEEHNVKSLPSLLQGKSTYEYLNREHPFPFVLTRGNSMGGG